ncbi:Ras-Related Protein Rab-8A [Manis pentadactyla]|nr:Ras-Related Protein Rab-8A [Manis pentadactyla]
MPITNRVTVIDTMAIHTLKVQIKRLLNNVKKMILGNKCDMNNKRQVSKEPEEKLALDYRIRFMEASVKANINVENTFFTLARDIKAEMDKKLEGNRSQGSNWGIKIMTDQQKKSSFF